MHSQAGTPTALARQHIILAEQLPLILRSTQSGYLWYLLPRHLREIMLILRTIIVPQVQNRIL